MRLVIYFVCLLLAAVARVKIIEGSLHGTISLRVYISFS